MPYKDPVKKAAMKKLYKQLNPERVRAWAKKARPRTIEQRAKENKRRRLFNEKHALEKSQQRQRAEIALHSIECKMRTCCYPTIKRERWEYCSPTCRGIAERRTCSGLGCDRLLPLLCHYRLKYCEWCKFCNDMNGRLRAGAQIKVWKRENKEKVAMQRHRRRATVRGSGVAPISPGFLSRLLLLQKFQCAAPHCRTDISLEGKSRCHVDHIFPISRGGRHAMDNLQLLCPRCNCLKRAKTMDEWAKDLAI